MGGKETKPEPPPPQKTVKEMVKEFTRTINRLRRDFTRERTKLEQNNKKIERDIKNMLKKGEPKNLVKNKNMMQKYGRLDAQMGDVLFQLNTAATTETLVKVMTGMGEVMKRTNESIDTKNIAIAIERFNIEVEKQNITAENIQDAMDDGEMEDADQETEQIIFKMEQELGGKGGGGGDLVNQNPNNQQMNQEDDFDAQLNALKN